MRHEISCLFLYLGSPLSWNAFQDTLRNQELIVPKGRAKWDSLLESLGGWLLAPNYLFLEEATIICDSSMARKPPSL
jgi:hypothetical protein